MSDMSSDGTDLDVHACDWECLDCGGVWTVKNAIGEDADLTDLPEFCPNCGDTPGWRNRKTGRKVPDYSTDGGRTLHTDTEH